MSNAPELLILRHGETVWNQEGRMQGALDSALTPKGEAQAAAQNRILKDFAPNGWQDGWPDGWHAFVSPQGRAQATAKIALQGITETWSTVDDLVEIGVGEWAGKVRADLVKDVPADVPLDDGPDGPLGLYAHAPGGEGFARLRTRAERFLDRLQGPAIVITHGVTSRMLRAVLLAQPDTRLGDLPGGQGVVYHLLDGVQTRLE